MTALVTILSIGAHYIGPSTMHMSEEIRKATVDYHIEHEIFDKRPFTTNIIVFLVEKIGFSYQVAFYLLQFTLFFFAGPAIYFYLKNLKLEHTFALAGMLIFLLSMPVFMAHFEPVHTWDDFWVYIFVPLGLGLALQGKVVLPAISIVVALLSRETTFLFLPIMSIVVYKSAQKSKLLNAFLFTVLTIIVYGFSRFALYGTETASPIDSLAFNFAGSARTSDTVFSFLVSQGFLWVIGIWQIFKKAAYVNYDLVRWGAVITVSGFISSTLLYGHARESRLFMPAAVFLIPLTLWYFQCNWPDLVSFIKLNARSKRVLGLMLLLFLILAVNLFFPSFEYVSSPHPYRLYLACHLWVVIVVVIFELWKSGKRPTILPKTR